MHVQAACHDIGSIIVTGLACPCFDYIYNKEHIYQFDLADVFIMLLQPAMPV